MCCPGAGIRGSFAPLPVSFVRASHQSHVSARSQTPEELDTVGPLQLEDSSALEAGDEGEEEGLDDRFMATLVQRQQQWQTDIPAGERRVAARVRQVSDFWYFFISFFFSFSVFPDSFQVFLQQQRHQQWQVTCPGTIFQMSRVIRAGQVYILGQAHA